MSTPSTVASSSPSAAPSCVVFLFDVDNTLLDNDSVVADLSSHLETKFGPKCRARYFEIFETMRKSLGYADYLGALQQYRVENPTDAGLLDISGFLIDYPFPKRVYPKALEAVTHTRRWGTPVVLSDGDVVFQPRKVHRSGVYEAVGGNVLIYIHKEEMLADVEKRFPADHYVLVDDKVRLLTAIKKIWGDKLTTVFPRQGHYAMDAKEVAKYPTPDMTVEHIGELADVDWSAILSRK